MNLNTLRHQNNELKASHKRMEKALLQIGSSQAQAHNNDMTRPTTNENQVPLSNKRQTSTQSNASQEAQAANWSEVLPVGQETWATVAK
jgi:hypothetical protein